MDLLAALLPQAHLHPARLGDVLLFFEDPHSAEHMDMWCSGSCAGAFGTGCLMQLLGTSAQVRQLFKQALPRLQGGAPAWTTRHGQDQPGQGSGSKISHQIWG